MTKIVMASEDLKGYDCNFVDPVPNSLICLICTCAARSAQQTACCGKMFCKACLLEWQSSQLDAKCPQCRKEIESFPDLRGDRDVKSLIVHCDNKAHGCEWTGELRSFEEHQSGCKFTLVPCPNECKDNVGHIMNIPLKEVRKHSNKCPRRPYKCRHCKEAGEYLERTTTHLKKCPSMKVACPNTTCRKRVARHSLTGHLTECPFEEVPCKYARIGCNARVPRRERDEHEGDTQQHFQMVVDSMSELKAKLEDLEHNIAHAYRVRHLYWRMHGVTYLFSRSRTLSSTDLRTARYLALRFIPGPKGTSYASKLAPTEMVASKEHILQSLPTLCMGSMMIVFHGHSMGESKWSY